MIPKGHGIWPSRRLEGRMAFCVVASTRQIAIVIDDPHMTLCGKRQQRGDKWLGRAAPLFVKAAIVDIACGCW